MYKAPASPAELVSAPERRAPFDMWACKSVYQKIDGSQKYCELQCVKSL